MKRFELRPSWLNWNGSAEIPSLVGPIIALVALTLVFTVLSDKFLTVANWSNTSIFASSVIILALGMTFVIITGGIDLSVGAVVAASGTVAATFLRAAEPTVLNAIVGSLIGLATGVAFGCLNGLLIVHLRVVPVIATLGTLGVGSGIAMILTNGMSIPIPDVIAPLGRAVLFGWLPLPVLITVLLICLTSFILRTTPFGLRTYAVGSNYEAARRTGVNVRAQLFMVYVISGTLAGIAGVLLMARFLVGSPAAGGAGTLLNAVAAPVIGGISLFGGRGRIGGTVVGGVIVTQAMTGLTLIGVGPYWQMLVIGVVIIAAVAVQTSDPSQALRRLRVRRGTHHSTQSDTTIKARGQ